MNNINLRLPTPDDASITHSQSLLTHITQHIEAAGGYLPFDRFMELALYAPKLGYYTAGSRKFGESGDFVTAPEISPLFAQCLAQQCQQVLSQLTSPCLLEFGAGSGRLAVDLMQSLKTLNCLPDSYYILEISPDLKARQQALIQQEIPQLSHYFHWLEGLPKEPIEAVIIANEVLDAMPVHRFRRHQAQWQEQMVEIKANGLALSWQPLRSIGLLSAIQALSLPDGAYESDINLRQKPWIHALSSTLSRGLVLLIDYGFPAHDYYHHSRDQGTLMCHYRHHAHADPLLYVGLQDITAHVDFTAIALSANEAGFHIAGYTSQAFFLLGSGLDKIMAQSDPTDIDSHMTLVQSVRRLTLPTEMGERFQVLGLSKGIASEQLIGFQMRDQRERL